MADFLSSLRSGVLLCDGAMGSYLFELTGRLSEANHVYESFNVDQPDLIEKVHRAYLDAGAQCLVTNTFGANRVQLQEYGLGNRLIEINRGGVAVARRAIERFQNDTGATGQFFVLGSIGPTQRPVLEPSDLEAAYGPQIDTLIGAGIDAVIFETFSSLQQLEQLITLLRSRANLPPIIAEMTMHSSSAGAPIEPDPRAFIQRMEPLGVSAVGVNCCAPWDANAFVDIAATLEPVRSGKLQLSVMPNGGGFQRIGNRFMTSVNPEFAGKMARGFMDRGVKLIGGCCEMHPPHILEMHNYLASRHGGGARIGTRIHSNLPPAGDAEKRDNGPFSRKLLAGKFVVSIELLPPRGTDEKLIQSKIQFVEELAASGLADAVDLTDGSRGIPLMSPGDFIHRIRDDLAWTPPTGDRVELIPHFTGRDLNAMGVQSRLIGYHANRIHNVLFITGDPPKMSPTYPRSTAVFDLDSVAMIQCAHFGLNSGVDFGGAALGKQPDPRTHFTIGTGFEPEAVNLQRERDRLEQKLDSGVDYVMTQPAFHHKPLAILEKYRDQRAFLVGVMILANLDQARRIAQIPGVVVPDEVLKRLAKYEDIADQAKAGQEIAIEQIRWIVKNGWRGLYLMSPATHRGIIDVLRAGFGSSTGNDIPSPVP